MVSTLKNIISKSYKIIAYFAVLLLLIVINYYHIFSNTLYVNAKCLFIVILEMIILILLNKLIINKINDKFLNVAIIFLAILFLVLEIGSVYYFKIKPGWDFKWLMDSSEELATKGALKIENANYFKTFPNNVAALVIVTGAMKLFGNNEIGAYIINIVFVFLAVIFSLLSAKKIGGNKLAINLIMLLVGCAPLYLYMPIVYTDTLSVGFPMMSLYFWLKSEELEKNNWKKYMYIVLMAVASMIGYFIKPVAAIVLLAIIIDKIFCCKKFIKPFAVILIICFIMTKLFNCTYEKIVQDKRGNELEYPLTHWLMMGLGLPFSEGGTSFAYGAYSQDDSDYTATSGDYDKKKEANIKKIKERLYDFGIKGYVKFLGNKFNFIWNDGTYYVINKIQVDTLNTSSIWYKIVIGENKEKIAVPYMTNFNNMLFASILIEICIEIKRKEKSDVIRILGISMVGIAIFFIAWEARSRYIYFLIPVFCLIGARGIHDISEILNTKNIQELFNSTSFINKKR